MKIIAGCIIRNEQGEYLLVQEAQERVKGKWNIPAGYADLGETPRQAAARETLEEVGLVVVPEAEPLYGYLNGEKGKRYYAFLATQTGGTLTIQESEIMAAEWLSFEAIELLHAQNQIRDEWIFEALQKAQDAYTRH